MWYLINPNAPERLLMGSSRNVQHLLVRPVCVASLYTLRIAPKHTETKRNEVLGPFTLSESESKKKIKEPSEKIEV